MDIVKLAAQLFMSRLGGAGGALDADAVQSALAGLLGGADGRIDLGGLVERFGGSGLAGIAASWLGDGANAALSPAQVVDALGRGQVAGFAGQLGLGEAQAADGLAAMLPELIDRCSSGGSLLEAAGGASGLLGAASKLFK